MAQNIDMNKLMQQAQQMQQQMAQAQEQLASETVEASAGGGLVTVRATGNGEHHRDQDRPEGDRPGRSGAARGHGARGRERSSALCAVARPVEARRDDRGLGLPALMEICVSTRRSRPSHRNRRTSSDACGSEPRRGGGTSSSSTRGLLRRGSAYRHIRTTTRSVLRRGAVYLGLGRRPAPSRRAASWSSPLASSTCTARWKTSRSATSPSAHRAHGVEPPVPDEWQQYVR